MRFGASLNEVVKIMPEKQNFPTPTAKDYDLEPLEKWKVRAKKKKKQGIKLHFPLRQAVKIMPEKQNFPTPTVADTFTDNLESSQQKEDSKHSVNLSQVIYMEKLYPTPATRDYKGARKSETMAKTGRNPETNSLPDAVEGQNTGQLNPDWVEWLMGFPVDWSNIDKNSTKDSLSWDVEPEIPRVTKDKQSRINRLKCLGNAVVPQVAELIGKYIVRVD